MSPEVMLNWVFAVGLSGLFLALVGALIGGLIALFRSES
jgi:hypothetical protein